MCRICIQAIAWVSDNPKVQSVTVLWSSGSVHEALTYGYKDKVGMTRDKEETWNKEEQ